MNYLNTILPASFGKIEFLLIDIPFVTPFVTSSYTWNGKQALILHLEADGVSGYGECVADPDPFYSPETTVSCRYIIREFILPLLKPGMALGEFLTAMEHIRGNYMAKATVENALVDLLARRDRVPLFTFLGLPKRRIHSGISLGLQNTPEELCRKVGEAVHSGYHRVKMKIKKGKDYQFIEAVRDKYPDILLMADANGDYQPEDRELLSSLDTFELTMIEQPLSYNDIYLHSQLQPFLKTPLCLDESIHSIEDCKTALDLNACGVINIKEGRVGGITNALMMAKLCAENNIPVWSGGMDETGIGRAFNIHLQCSPYFTLPGDTSETTRYFKEDIIDKPVVLEHDGFIEVPEGHGTGVEVIPAKLQKFLLATEEVTL